ncbi:unnamed protein product [Rangifer tarandus platyrhynchus]|uniref:Uncharacterized protein n=2 Tax=Rangifer tarandus platyrhynchus TaxID=3082113 RepID=A0ABN8YTG2_RANTA|nr:unnamed protein product [Rangifer tarandus platyrhynchus]CAI9702449.1 unnamed protein product [Rangifer tarandus platyrhynchus]
MKDPPGPVLTVRPQEGESPRLHLSKVDEGRPAISRSCTECRSVKAQTLAHGPAPPGPSPRPRPPPRRATPPAPDVRGPRVEAPRFRAAP